MERHELLRRIAGGRTDLVIELLRRDDWREALGEGPIDVLQWLVYYGDVTGLRAVLAAGGDLATLDLGQELGHAAFFGHWKTCDFLLAHGADVNHAQADTGETALHSALAKAGRPYYLLVLRVLLENGADVHARTKPGVETGAFMRDVRTVGETALHRAAAYGDEAMIRLLLEHGARRARRLTALVGEPAPATGGDPRAARVRRAQDRPGARRHEHERPRRRVGERDGAQARRRVPAGEHGPLRRGTRARSAAALTPVVAMQPRDRATTARIPCGARGFGGVPQSSQRPYWTPPRK
jgi:hypothetical protein